MKRAGYLLPGIADVSNLARAFHKASGGRRQTSVVRDFSLHLDARLSSLSRGILDNSVSVGQYRRFVVHDPKKRVIHAAAFPERVLHHGIMNICGQIFERGAIADSHACRLGKGNYAALLRARHFAARYKYCLKLDIRRFFDSVEHDYLKQRIRRLFKDGGLLLLLDRIVDSYCTAPGRGLPIGALTSQYFANFYLDAFDRFVKEGLRCGGYVRFMDDFVLWDDSAPRLDGWRQEMSTWLKSVMGLEFKSYARPGPVRDGMTFLGFRILPGRILVARGSRHRYRLRLAQVEEAFSLGEIPAAQLQRRAGSLTAFVKQGHCRRWRQRLLTEADFLQRAVAC